MDSAFRTTHIPAQRAITPHMTTIGSTYGGEVRVTGQVQAVGACCSHQPGVELQWSASANTLPLLIGPIDDPLLVRSRLPESITGEDAGADDAPRQPDKDRAPILGQYRSATTDPGPIH